MKSNFNGHRPNVGPSQQLRLIGRSLDSMV